MPSKKANFFDRVELYPYKTKKFLKYLKYQLKIKIKSNLAGKVFGKKSDQKPMRISSARNSEFLFSDCRNSTFRFVI